MKNGEPHSSPFSISKIHLTVNLALVTVTVTMMVMLEIAVPMIAAIVRRRRIVG